MRIDRQVAILEGHPEEVYHCEFVLLTGEAEAAGRGAKQDDSGKTLILVASSESLFVWDLATRTLMQKADAPGTTGSSLTPEGVESALGTMARVCTPSQPTHATVFEYERSVLSVVGRDDGQGLSWGLHIWMLTAAWGAPSCHGLL